MTHSSDKIRFGCALLVALIAGIALSSLPLRAQGLEGEVTKSTETLDQATQGIAADLASSLKANQQDQVFLGPIELVGIENKIALPLAKALEGQGIKIVEKTKAAGKWRISGEANGELLKEGGVHVVLECKLRPPAGGTHTVVRYAVTSAEEIRKMSGLTVAASGGDAKKQSQEVASALGDPRFQSSEGGKVISAVGAPQYAIQLFVQRRGEGPYVPVEVVQDEGQPREGEIVGQPVVDLEVKDNYAVKVINNSGRGASVEIEIDGINMFEFCDVPAWKRLGKMYVEKGQAPTITGWYFPQNRTRKFTVVNQEDGLFAQLGRPRSSVGFITVRFGIAWGESEVPPSDEPRAQGATATGAGEFDDKSAGFQAAKESKTFGRVRSQVSIRYSRPTDLPPPDLPKQ
jgi:hypothetical protein